MPVLGDLPNALAIYPGPAGPLAVPGSGSLAVLRGGSWRAIPGTGTTASDQSLTLGPSAPFGQRVVAFMTGPQGPAPWQLTVHAKYM